MNILVGERVDRGPLPVRRKFAPAHSARMHEWRWFRVHLSRDHALSILQLVAPNGWGESQVESGKNKRTRPTCQTNVLCPQAFSCNRALTRVPTRDAVLRDRHWRSKGMSQLGQEALQCPAPN